MGRNGTERDRMRKDGRLGEDGTGLLGKGGTGTLEKGPGGLGKDGTAWEGTGRPHASSLGARPRPSLYITAWRRVVAESFRLAPASNTPLFQ